MSVAALLVFPKILWNYFNLRTFATVLLGFALGAAPIIRYNVREPLATFRGNTTWDASDLRGKTQLLTTTFSGQTLFGYIARNDPEGHPREPAHFSRTALRPAQRLRRPSRERPSLLRLPGVAGHDRLALAHSDSQAGPLLPDRRNDRLVTDAIRQRRRRRGASCDSALAFSYADHRAGLRRSRAALGPLWRSGDHPRRLHGRRMRIAHHQRVLRPLRAQRNRPSVDRRHLSALRFSQTCQARHRVHRRLGHAQQSPGTESWSASVTRRRRPSLEACAQRRGPPRNSSPPVRQRLAARRSPLCRPPGRRRAFPRRQRQAPGDRRRSRLPPGDGRHDPRSQRPDNLRDRAVSCAQRISIVPNTTPSSEPLDERNVRPTSSATSTEPLPNRFAGRA